LQVLSGLGNQEDPAPAAAGSRPSPLSQQPSPTKTQSWSQKLISWLGRERAAGDVEMQLSLDELDQPHVSVQGENAQAIEAALAQDPTWLQEFRELALDRSAELGGAANGSASATPLSLKITQRDGELETTWQ
jgi:hypothetical protein